MSWSELRGDYEEPRDLAQCLRNFVDQNQQSLRRLEQLIPYSRSVISERLSGEHRPEREFIEALIGACAGDDAEAEARMLRVAMVKWHAADPSRLTEFGTPVPGPDAPSAYLDVERLVERIVERLQPPREQPVPGPATRPRHAPDNGSLWGWAPERNPFFIGRSELMARLHEGFATDHTQVLYGLLGGGKTHLAIEYVRRPETGYDMVGWIPAGEPSLAGSALAALAPRLGLETVGTPRIMDAARAVVAALEDGVLGDNWLLVFDGADLPKGEILELIPRSRGHVLVTSRDPAWRWAVNVGRTIRVGTFTRGESIEFLLKRLGPLSVSPRHGRSAEDAVSEALGDLPLGLEQAAALLRGPPHLSVDDYLAELADEPGQALDRGTPTGYPMTFKFAFGLAYAQLGARSPEASALLGHCARCPLDPVPVPSSGQAGAEAVSSLDPEFLALLTDRFGAVEQLGRSGLVDAAVDAIRLPRPIRALAIAEFSEPPMEK